MNPEKRKCDGYEDEMEMKERFIERMPQSRERMRRKGREATNSLASVFRIGIILSRNNSLPLNRTLLIGWL
jgi:hypothetical protein